MDGKIGLKGLKNVNLSSLKETAKITSALTLLLSTVACSQEAESSLFLIGAPLLCIFGPIIVGAVIGGVHDLIYPPVNEKFKGPNYHDDKYHLQ